MNKSLLITLADKNYIDYAKQLFSSVYWNAGWKGDYMLFAHEIPTKDLIWFRNKGILVKECTPIDMKKLAGIFPISTLNKLYLFSPELKKWDNIVFLDPDIIVRSSLYKLATVKGFYAVQDIYKNRHLKSQFNLKGDANLAHELKKKFKLRAPALNTGVMAFSTDIITNTTLDELLNIGKHYEKISFFAEQSVFNLFFYKKWKKLSFLYNFIIPLVVIYHQQMESFNPVVMHFCDKPKPWSPDSPFHKEWQVNMEKSELIDLANRPIGTIENRIEIKTLWYNLKFVFPKCIRFIRDMIRHFNDFIERNIGRVGIILKKKYPSLFYKLRSVLFKKK